MARAVIYLQKPLILVVILAFLSGNPCSLVSAKSYSTKKFDRVRFYASHSHLQIQRGAEETIVVEEVYSSSDCTTTSEVLQGFTNYVWGQRYELKIQYTGTEDKLCRSSLLISLPEDFKLPDLVIYGGAIVLRLNAVNIESIYSGSTSVKIEAIGKPYFDRSTIDEISFENLSSTLALTNYDVRRVDDNTYQLGEHISVDIHYSTIHTLALNADVVQIRGSENSVVSSVDIGWKNIKTSAHIPNMKGNFKIIGVPYTSQLSCYLKLALPDGQQEFVGSMSFGSVASHVTLDVPENTTVYAPPSAEVEADDSVKVVDSQRDAHLKIVAGSYANSTLSLKLGTSHGSNVTFDESYFSVPTDSQASSSMRLSPSLAYPLYGVLVTMGLITQG